MERSGRPKKKPESTPEAVPVEITTVQGLLALRGSIVKYTMDSGTTWHYAKLWDSDRLVTFAYTPIYASLPRDAIPARNEGVSMDEEVEVINGKPVHSRSSITVFDFLRPGFAVFTTTAKETEGKRFSYDNLR